MEFKVKEVAKGKQRVQNIKSKLIPTNTARVEERFNGLEKGLFESMSLILDHHRRCLCRDRLNQLMRIRINVQVLQEINREFKERLFTVEWG